MMGPHSEGPRERHVQRMSAPVMASMGGPQREVGMTTSMAAPLIWVLTDDRPGTAVQALAVADALGGCMWKSRSNTMVSRVCRNLLRGASLIGIIAPAAPVSRRPGRIW